MSVERMVKGSLWTTVAARVVGDVLLGASNVVLAVGRALDGLSETAFYVEADAARRYRNLTGVDLGYVVGQDDRFEATHPDYEPENWTVPVEEDDDEA